MYKSVLKSLQRSPRSWLVTGVAGFIGSNILEVLLANNQFVRGMDNFATGSRENLRMVRELVSSNQWDRFSLLEGDITDIGACREACAGVDYVLHQAALGSVPRSIADPIATNAANVTGFLNMILAGKDAKVSRFVYAASSSTYGDHPDLPKREHLIGRALSPYAVTKYVNELYADVFNRQYGLDSIGLRYFNVFGRRQDPNGPYAAVIPRWINALLSGAPININGDGSTTRDFCYVDNVVQANLLAATTTNTNATNQVYNVAVGDQTSLKQMLGILRDLLVHAGQPSGSAESYGDFRRGDVLHSLADISKARSLLGYHPTHNIESGLRETLAWYLERSR